MSDLRDFLTDSFNAVSRNDITCSFDAGGLTIRVPIKILLHDTPRHSKDGFKTVDIDKKDLIDHSGNFTINASSDMQSGVIIGATKLSLELTIASKKPEDHPEFLRAEIKDREEDKRKADIEASERKEQK